MISYEFMKNFHSGWRWLVVLVGALAILKLLLGVVSRGKWSKLDQALGAATPIMLDVQWLLGIVIYIMGQWYANPAAVAGAEHPTTMTLALIAAHIGWSRAKQASDDGAKFRNALLGFVVAGVLIALGIWRVTSAT
jgi:hypothetical protein